MTNRSQFRKSQSRQFTIRAKQPDDVQGIVSKLKEQPDNALISARFLPNSQSLVIRASASGQEGAKRLQTRFRTSAGILSEDRFQLATPELGPGDVPNPSTGGGGTVEPAECPEDDWVGKNIQFNLDPDVKDHFDKKIAERQRGSKPVTIYVLDNSPYGNSPDLFAGHLRQYSQNPYVVDTLKTPYEAQNPTLTIEADTNSPIGYTDDQDYMSNHGIFICSIIKSIAPGANVILKPVFDTDGRGSLAVLEDALNTLPKPGIPAPAPQEPNDHTEQILVNLSMTVDKRYAADEIGAVADMLDNIANPEERDNIAESYGIAPPDENGEQTGIRKAIIDFIAQHRRIVAAAGNDGIDSGSKPWPGFPARMLGVLSVGACDKHGGITDYTNWCRIPQTISPEAKTLLAERHEGPNSGDNQALFNHGIYAYGGVRKEGIHGFYERESIPSDPNPCPNRSGVAQWSGTSFATAVATGYMAYLCLNGMTAQEAYETLLSLPASAGGAPTLVAHQSIS